MVTKRQETGAGWIEEVGIHCCHFYHGIPHLLSSVVPLVQLALHRNARCTLSLDAALRHGAVAGLTAAGFDVPELKRRDRLELLIEPQIVRLYRAGAEGLEQQYRHWEERLQESGLVCQFFIGQAEPAIKAIGWESFLCYEREIGMTLKDFRINMICLYPFARACMGPHYEEIRAVHPRLLSAGSLLDYKSSMVGGTA